MGETCCCGTCSVETGTFFIAILDILWCCSSITKYIVHLNSMINSPEQLPAELFPSFEENKAFYITLYIAVTIMTIVYCGVSMLLFAGARARNYRQCVPWVYWNYISMGCVSLAVFVGCCFAAVNGQLGLAIAAFFVVGAFLSIAIYCVNVVKRFITELKAA